jgi:hypothetical protein
MAIASATFPNQKAMAIVMLFHIVLSGIVSGPYAKWYLPFDGKGGLADGPWVLGETGHRTPRCQNRTSALPGGGRAAPLPVRITVEISRM